MLWQSVARFAAVGKPDTTTPARPTPSHLAPLSEPGGVLAAACAHYPDPNPARHACVDSGSDSFHPVNPVNPVKNLAPPACMLARVPSAAVTGIEAYPVEVEVNAGCGDTVLVTLCCNLPSPPAQKFPIENRRQDAA